MAFEKITENVENISLLADTPAMTSTELKAEFDKGNKTIKNKFNKLIDDLNEELEKVEGELISDFNNATERGYYYGNSNTANTPGSSNWFLQVIDNSANQYVTQIAYRFRNNEVWVRHYNKVDSEETLSWKPWVMISNNYYTAEKRVGTWIDNKPIYRKVIDLGIIGNTNPKEINVEGSYDTLISFNGYMYDSNGNKTPLRMNYLDGHWINAEYEVNSSNLKIRIYRDNNSSWSNWYLKIIIEYTKTTD